MAHQGGMAGWRWDGGETRSTRTSVQAGCSLPLARWSRRGLSQPTVTRARGCLEAYGDCSAISARLSGSMRHDLAAARNLTRSLSELASGPELPKPKPDGPGLTPEKRQQDDDGDRHPDQPQQDGTAHDVLLVRRAVRNDDRRAARRLRWRRGWLRVRPGRGRDRSRRELRGDAAGGIGGQARSASMVATRACASSGGRPVRAATICVR